ncbi:ribosomal RNA small subunit 16S rRNA processing protein RimM [Neokomagataea thailandica NBRC 106555]|uniref:Ribosome maturation factor RimM n=2 Tax=Neokomagataea TaxID=1223423 RepID=A0A4Y6V748_9PROT|nr:MULTISPECIES: ribosome maturation factor RimM [Neokomagataea]QDH24155.1 16S rRNA processing protein RimM [Neokomagataea tanensis]GBR50549.1 ribosomal RNA small subunit 16S rRNA processing protein RimM [Neokomagataea thailandica NBRC 106555]
MARFKSETDVLVATIGRPHGVRGLVRLHAATDDAESVEDLNPLHDEQGVVWNVRWVSLGVAALEDEQGVALADRTAAERLVNRRLYVAREDLPEADEDEFYHTDLVGMEAFSSEGLSFGVVTVVHDYGAGVSLEIVPSGDGKILLVPFTRACVPEVDLAARRLLVVPPHEIEVEGTLDGEVQVRS